MQTSTKYCVTHEYPMMINGQEVIVKRYDNPEMEAQVSNHSNLSFHRKNRLNNVKHKRIRNG